MRIGHEISEKKENTVNQNTGKIMVSKNKDVQFVELLFRRFLSLALVQFTHTHTLYMDGRAFLTN